MLNIFSLKYTIFAKNKTIFAENKTIFAKNKTIFAKNKTNLLEVIIVLICMTLLSSIITTEVKDIKKNAMSTALEVEERNIQTSLDSYETKKFRIFSYYKCSA